MAAIVGQPLSLDHKWNFLVEIDEIERSKFSKCSNLEAEIKKVEYREGGSRIPNKSPGTMDFSDITLERGSSSDFDMYNWFRQTADASANGGKGAVDNAYKRTLDIKQLDHDQSVKKRWRVVGAWPTKFIAGEWDASSNEVVIESVTLTFDAFFPA